MAEFFNSFLGGAVTAFLLANILNFIEMIMLLSVMKDVRNLLNQFKQEGNKGKWLE